MTDYTPKATAIRNTAEHAVLLENQVVIMETLRSLMIMANQGGTGNFHNVFSKLGKEIEESNSILERWPTRSRRRETSG